MKSKRGIVFIGVVVLVSFAAATRRPDQVRMPQFYGDDGYVFFAQNAGQGLSAIWHSSSGYLHLLPRLVALACSPLPWEWLPFAYSLAGFVSVGIVAARIATASIPPAAAWAGAVGMVAVPICGEPWGNICCLHFALGALMLVNLLEEPPVGRTQAVRRGIELSLALLSGPSAVLLAPWLLVRAWQWRRSRPATMMVSIAAVSLIIQCAVMTTHQRKIASLPLLEPSVTVIAPIYLRALFANWTSLARTVENGRVVAWLAVPVVVCIFVFTGRKEKGIALALISSAVLLAAFGRLVSPGWPNPYGEGMRYLYLPFMLVVWSFGWLAAGAKNRVSAVAACFLVSLVAASALSEWTSPPLEDFDWSGQVARARAGTLHVFTIPGSPPWTFPVPTKAPSSGSHAP